MQLTVPSLGKDDQFDCCIIGTGPAGITCALSLAESGKLIALLEGGGRDWSEWSQSLYQGEIIGDPYFDLNAARLRFFGGTSNHWLGLCRPLDEIDFEAKGSFDKTEWPIRKTDLDPYLVAASKILEIPDVPNDRPIPGSGLKQIQFVWSPPVRFAEKFEEQLVSDGRICLAFDANLVGLETNGTDITGALIVDSDGNTRRIRANCYVLATGGIENSRILLWSNAQTNGQIVQNASNLGRYWIEHPTFTLGNVILTGELAFDLNQSSEYRFFSPTLTTMSEAGILNCGLRFTPVSYDGTRKIIADIACVTPDLASWMSRQLGRQLICGAKVSAAWEQEPRPENRIELSTERDALGVPRPRLYWRKSATDLRTVQVVAQRFGVYLAQSNTGRLRLNPWVLGEGEYPTDDELAGFHHMGGTRMAASPDDGIVDSNCKVFGQSNLYIAGSSVFPSGGHANPTLTIVQLALRLADRLRAY